MTSGLPVCRSIFGNLEWVPEEFGPNEAWPERFGPKGEEFGAQTTVRCEFLVWWKASNVIIFIKENSGRYI